MEYAAIQLKFPDSRSVKFVRDQGMTEIKLFINGIKDPKDYQKSRQTL